ncbi:hypothetical protein BKA70DRAFT_1442389 [Coprinopsis sp. MPI-PUGE-AT-0042]|nr:hypothetical protein BKA70DRAFT_1442389 [Coprinopsis sp. MPI-PUGE-AT-0042]
MAYPLTAGPLSSESASLSTAESYIAPPDAPALTSSLGSLLPTASSITGRLKSYTAPSDAPLGSPRSFSSDLSSDAASSTPRSSVREAVDVGDCLRKPLVILEKELIGAEVASKLTRNVDSKIAIRQRKYYFMEQLCRT